MSEYLGVSGTGSWASSQEPKVHAAAKDSGEVVDNRFPVSNRGKTVYTSLCGRPNLRQITEDFDHAPTHLDQCQRCFKIASR